MSEEDAFVAGIREHPLDDLRRLVYADWLDERGRPEHAEYLRLVAALAAPGEAIDVTHPHAVRLVEVAEGIEHTWREAVGGRFDLWLDGCDPARKVRFMVSVSKLSGCGLAASKAYYDTLPQIFDVAAPYEWLARIVNGLEGSPVTRVVPGRLDTRCPIPLRQVVLRYQVWVSATHTPESFPNGIEHMRRTIGAQPDLSHLLPDVPDLRSAVLQDTQDREMVFSFPLATGLSWGKAARVADFWGRRLFGGRSLLGTKADPPFVGLVSVRTDAST